ncbi:MAG TPA: NADH-ubiquinone oxidoreductase-F iron-sulfur binding region domain-containing protein [Solirubrobacteraceae bacterium]|jgi:NADH:ubiquinone oxidoreductase subunit F (NADH-binding)|nr:NADH-ubiquinone oxidoreductase-F iron-sulfur binding region domain-containing protein [Solirubrobacteraceae bacterium]
MSRDVTTIAAADASLGAPDGRSLPRLLLDVPSHEPMSLDHHLAAHGEPAHEPRRGRRRHESPLIDRVERAGLRGRGGAAFPTAVKLRAVARGRRPIVVVNAAEGEPASLKDRTLSELLPHLMLDGGELAAEAVGAEEVIVCVCESAIASVESVSAAIEERRGRRGSSVRTQLSVVPSGYVVGQESALVNHLNGGPAIPTFSPPLPFQQGLRRRPTLINNAETLAQLALIARHGSTWFRELGTPSQPGSALVTLSGPVAYPGVYEIEPGSSLTSLIDAAGGATAPARAALLGGYAGAWIDGSLLAGVRMSDEHLATHGASLGAGVVLLLSQDACPVAETARVARWLADQSTRQCGPCVNGLDALAATVEEIAGGATNGNAGKRIERLAALVRRRGACGHPDGVANFILSALQTFAAAFADHARHGPCESCAGVAELPLPAWPRRDARRREPVAF